ncbi:MAG: hypothetical protein WCG12_17295 [Alcaligenaceae bacterium]
MAEIAKESGALTIAIVTKPFSFEELLARIRALSRRPKNINDEVLKVDDLSLNPLSFLVMRGDKIIELSRKEFSLLEYMMRNKNKVLSKSDFPLFDLRIEPYGF